MRRRHAAALAATRIRTSIPTGAPAVIAGSLAGSLALLLTAVPADATELPASGEAPRLVALTPKPAASPASLAPASVAAPPSHTVQPGDTVSGIASRYGLRTADVLAINGLDRSSVIYPGQVLTLTGTAQTVAPAAPAASASTYSIVAGDTISAIASRHGTSTQALLDANGLSRASIIYPGQTLSIPGTGMTPAASVAPAPTPAPPPSGASYTITAGDTISAIASRHGTSTQAVLDANGLTRASIIYPGQTLTIPGGAVAAVPAAATATVAGLDAEQTETARTIVRIGREAGVSDRGIAIALATGMVESWLRNLDWGDRDSLGVFQQRPSQGWGTEAEVRDVVRATKVFYGGAGDPNGTRTRGLLDIPGWETMAFSDAAQAVQISAYPERYGQWEQQAFQWLAALG